MHLIKYTQNEQIRFLALDVSEAGCRIRLHDARRWSSYQCDRNCSVSEAACLLCEGYELQPTSLGIDEEVGSIVVRFVVRWARIGLVGVHNRPLNGVMLYATQLRPIR